ncbi:MAG TPA: hypothetical protein VK943_14290, partial [Arenibaculum sp.]|nr:hypothetical protein [Arenibaculum sp.]
MRSDFLASLFDRIIVVNLDRRPDRMARVALQLEALEMPFERFSAIDGADPAVCREWETYAALPLAEPPTTGRTVGSYREFYLDYDTNAARIAFVERKARAKAIATSGAWGLLRSMERAIRHALER